MGDNADIGYYMAQIVIICYVTNLLTSDDVR